MKNKKRKEIPKTLEECFLALDNIFSSKDKITFCEMTEDEFFMQTHFGVGFFESETSIFATINNNEKVTFIS